VKKSKLSGIQSLGIELIAGDLNDSVEVLTSTLRGFDVVISTVGSVPDSLKSQFTLVNAARNAGVKVFIPSEFGFDVENTDSSILPLVKVKLQLEEELKKTANQMGYLIITVGMFGEYLLSPFAGVDVQHTTITAPFSFNTRVTTTTLDTISKSVAELIVQRISNQHIYLASDTVSYEQIAQALEKATGKPFSRVVVSPEKIDSTIAAEPGNVVAKFQKWIGVGKGMSWEKSTTWNATHGIPTTDIDTIAKTAISQKL